MQCGVDDHGDGEAVLLQGESAAEQAQHVHPAEQVGPRRLLRHRPRLGQETARGPQHRSVATPTVHTLAVQPIPPIQSCCNQC